MADRSVSVVLRAIVGPYQAAMARARTSTAALNTQVGALNANAGRVAGGMGRAAGGASSLTRNLTGLSPKLLGAGGIVFGLKQAADASIEWEAAFADVRKTVDGTPEQLGRIETGLRKMSGQIPTSAEDLAGIAASAGQLGIETDNVLDFTKTIADLGETTNLAGEQGATELARFANITQMAQGDFDRLGSSIVDLGNNFATTESEISQMAMRLAGAGNVVGMTQADILGIAAAASSAGLRAEEAGSSISRVMLDMQGAVETGGEKLEGFAEVAGMSAQQFQEAWRDDPAAALNSFITGLGDVVASGEGATQILEDLELSDVRVSRALLNMAGSGDVLSEALDTSSKAWEDNTALAEEAAIRYDTAAAKIGMAKNELGELVRLLGGPVGELFGFAAEVVGTGAAIVNETIRAAGDPGNTPAVEEHVEGVREFTEQREFGPGTGPQTVTGPPEDRPPPPEPAVLEGVPSGSVEQIERAEAALQGSFEAVLGIGRFTGGAGKAINELVGPYSDLAVAVEDALKAQQEHAEWLQSSTDPVFKLHAALEQVDEAQLAYNEAVEEFGANSPEAQSAALDLAMSVRDAELAAIDGELSFGDFEQKLRDWVNQGVITKEEADDIRDRVRLLREESERYEGPYRGSFHADTAEAKKRIKALLDQVAQIPRDVNVSVTFTADGNVIANIPGTGRIPVGTGGTSRPAPSGSTGGSTGSTSIRGGSGIPVAHDGMHVTDGLPRQPGDGPDERTIRTQVGETILPKHQPAMATAAASGPTHQDNRVFKIYGEVTPRTEFRARDMAGL